MPSKTLEKLDVLVGDWMLTLSDAWFPEPAGATARGSATVEWLGEAFLIMRTEMEGTSSLAIGRSDARDDYTALYHDSRGVRRAFATTFQDEGWTLSREDPDFRQARPGIPPRGVTRAEPPHAPPGSTAAETRAPGRDTRPERSG